MMHPPHADIASLLAHACRRETLLGVGRGYAVHALDAGADWAPYAMRVRRNFSAHELRHTSALVPVPHLHPGLDVGEALLTDSRNTVALVACQPGHNIQALHDLTIPHRDMMTGERAMAPLLMQARAGKNPCTDVVETSYRLLRSGYNPDLHWGNLVLEEDTGKLRLVDQLSYRQPPMSHHEAIHALREGCVGRLFNAITQHNIVTRNHETVGTEFPAYIERCDRLHGLLMRACAQVEAQYRHTPLPPVRIANPHTQLVPLTDTPQQLLQQLRTMQATTAQARAALG